MKERSPSRPESRGDSSARAELVPGKTTLTDQLARVQRRADPGAREGDVQAAAAQGVSGSSSSLPFLDQIQQSFGPAHDLSGVQAHTDGAAAAGSRAMGATAFASGDHVAFGGAPDLHTAAHEAAHVVQQRGGVQLEGGVGEAGDPYEQHADAVADRVVGGVSAASLLGGEGGEASTAPAVQRKEEKKKVDPKAAELKVINLLDALDLAFTEVPSWRERGLARQVSAAQLDAFVAKLAADQHALSIAMDMLDDSGSARADELHEQVVVVSNQEAAAEQTLRPVQAALHAGEATAHDAKHEAPPANMHQQANVDHPAGVCEGANGEPGCALSPAERDRYQKSIDHKVTTAHTTWIAAINAVKVDLKLQQLEPTFAQALGEAMLGLLIGIVVKAAAAAVKVGVEKVANKVKPPGTGAPSDVSVKVKPPETEAPPDVSVKVKPPETGAPPEGGTKWKMPDEQKKIVDDTAAKVGPKITGKLNGTDVAGQPKQLTPAQLADKTKPPPLPAQFDSLLEAMKSAPTVWVANIHANLDQLLDDDLVALDHGIPDEATLTQSHFEAQVRDTLSRYQTQVDNTREPSQRRTHAVMVYNKEGMPRMALVQQELHESHKFQDTKVSTGKWDFVQWVDDDMQAMSWEASRTDVKGAGRRGYQDGESFQMANNASFWSPASINRLASFYDAEHPHYVEVPKEEPPPPRHELSRGHGWAAD